MFCSLSNCVYIYLTFKTKDMTTQEINKTRLEAISVINNIIVLKTNVANRCPSSRTELAIELPRLEKIKAWAKANDQIQEIKLYLVQKTFGQHLQFAATEVSTFFHN